MDNRKSVECPSCGADMSRPGAVLVEYSLSLSTNLAPGGRLLLAEVVDVAENAEEAEPRSASCTACGEGFLMEAADLEGTEWE